MLSAALMALIQTAAFLWYFVFVFYMASAAGWPGFGQGGCTYSWQAGCSRAVAGRDNWAHIDWTSDTYHLRFELFEGLKAAASGRAGPLPSQYMPPDPPCSVRNVLSGCCASVGNGMTLKNKKRIPPMAATSGDGVATEAAVCARTQLEPGQLGAAARGCGDLGLRG